MDLAISNIVTAQVNLPQTGLSAYSVNTVGIMSNEVPAWAIQVLTLSGIAASGAFVFNSANGATASINWNDSADAIQTKLQAVTGQKTWQVSGSIASESLIITCVGTYGAVAAFTVSSNTLLTAGSVAITFSIATTVAGNSLTLVSGSAYGIYLSPQQAQTDWGSTSNTYQMVNAIFSQSPNILNGNGGYVVVMPYLNAVQTLTLSGVPASGTFEIVSSNGTTAAINFGDTAAQIQTKLQAVTGQSGWQVNGSLAGELLTISCLGTYGAVSVFTIAANSLQTAGSAAITFVIATTQAGETFGPAITRTTPVVQYFGVMATQILNQADELAAASVIAGLQTKLGFFVSITSADLNPGGLLDLLRSGLFQTSRGLYYGGPNALSGLLYMASYVGRALSVNFNSSLSTITMQLKQLVGIQPDPTMTQAIYNAASIAGVDIYPTFQGVPGVACFGTNRYFDSIYNQLWFVGNILVSNFNVIAQTGTKILQTESGMNQLKTADRTVCEAAVTNGMVAPGSWTSPTTFGNQADFLANIQSKGYYIYSVPVAQQLATARAARQASPISIAYKESGAIHSSNTIVNLNF